MAIAHGWQTECMHGGCRRVTNGSYLMRNIWELHIGPLIEVRSATSLDLSMSGVTVQRCFRQVSSEASGLALSSKFTAPVTSCCWQLPAAAAVPNDAAAWQASCWTYTGATPALARGGGGSLWMKASTDSLKAGWHALQVHARF